MTERHPELDAIVIGAGQAGPSLAVRCAREGMKTVLIERGPLGGTCINNGCVPTKTWVASARAAQVARRAAEWGVVVGAPVRVDMAAVRARKDKLIAASHQSLAAWLGSTPNLTVVQGEARFTGPRTLQVGDVEYSAPRIFLNVGGAPLRPAMPGLDQVHALDNRGILELDHVPEHLVIIGGSYIGLEFAQIFRRFGSQVTVCEMGPRIIGREDEEVSTAVAQVLEREGIVIRTDAKCLSVAREGAHGVRVHTSCESGEPDVVGSHLLLAVGRTPNTADLGLDVAGIATDARGFITVDDQLRSSSAAGVWGAGRLQRPRRLHAHLVQRLRDRRRQPVRQRPAPGQSAHPRLCAVHRPAAGAHRHERERGARGGQAGAGRTHADDTRRARARGRRDAGLHEGAGRCTDAAHPRRDDARPECRRGHPRPARRDGRRPAVHDDPAHDAHPPDGERAGADAARRLEAAGLKGCGACYRRDMDATMIAADEVSAHALCEAFNASFADYLLKFPPFDAAAWQTFLQRQGVDLSRSRAALRGDVVTAFILITPRTQRRTRIAVMGAVPTERGSGLAARLLDGAIEQARLLGERWLVLEVFSTNPRAAALYRGRGFAPVCELHGWRAEAAQGEALDSGAAISPVGRAACRAMAGLARRVAACVVALASQRRRDAGGTRHRAGVAARRCADRLHLH